MHILLTDVVTCPRCGPEFGLVLQADAIEERRVATGRLGCPNCRGIYEIAGGVADLRGDASAEPPSPGATPADDPERGFRCAALLGVSDSSAPVAVVEAEGRLAGEVATHLGATHVIGASLAAPPEEGPAAGVLSRILIGTRLPLRSRAVRGAAFLGPHDRRLLTEAARVLAPGGRLVVDPAPSWLPGWLGEGPLSVHLDQDGVVVASSPGVG